MTEQQAREIQDYQTILELKHHRGWELILKDIQSAFDDISHNWFNIEEWNDKARQEARVRQLANKYLLDLLSLYENRLKALQIEIIEQDHNSDPIPFDVDTTPENEGEHDAT